jgi:hypothetical protein
MLSVVGEESTVQNHNNPRVPAERDAPSEAIELPRLPWQAEVGQLLAQAAQLCVQHGLDLDNYMSGAWAAYVEARPGLREQIEEMQLRDQLSELRKHGRMGQA